MNDRMTPLSFDALMRWALASPGDVFGVRRPTRVDPAKTLSLFGETMERPFGPAAGPHTQLAQNIIAAYAAGARFFELKTVQILDGEDLPVSKPCILANDEGYNVEWSTELTVPDAFDEYVKAWFAIKLLSRVLKLGGENGFIFNMSVGYDLAGIQSPKIDTYIEGMKDASETPIWTECAAWAREHLDLLPGLEATAIDAISPNVCTSITLSTLHGCPPDEIERIAAYLLTEKGLHTFVKCNPTLLGYDFARRRMDEMGYDYLVFDDHHFKNDLQFDDAVPMLTRLQAIADKRGLSFGVKLTNTFPVRIDAGELPGEEMYMSGRPLFALATALCARLSEAFGGKLRISYSGGADATNIAQLYDAGIWPITVATTLLKPGGYQRLTQMADALAQRPYAPFAGVDVAAIRAIADAASSDARYTKPLKAAPSRKAEEEKVPLLDCFEAPCGDGCPIHQDVPEYIRLAGKGQYLDALRVITRDNPLPFITGTICNHRCQDRCRRNFYEETVHIRDVKLLAAEQAMDALLAEIVPPAKTGPRVAIIGGGPGGLAAAYFLARGGMDVTIFEKTDALGGVVRHVIPPFRIGGDAIDRDIALVQAMGVTVKLNHPVTDLEPLRAQGYHYFIVAVGAGARACPETIGSDRSICATDFLEQFHKDPTTCELGKTVAVIGAGNTAMDAARAATRVPGVEKVVIVYRRDVRNMPADEEELALAQADGVCFETLLQPQSYRDGVLRCGMMALGHLDADGRRKPEPTGAEIDMPFDSLIAATGDDRDHALLAGLSINHKHDTALIGDVFRGPATVVQAIGDARWEADKILRREGRLEEPATREANSDTAVNKKGAIMPFTTAANESYRCLECDAICECCVDVCPNRANVSILVHGRPQIVHIDRLCNACGNCETFCPYDSAPYKEKFTLFTTQADYDDNPAPGALISGTTIQAAHGGSDATDIARALVQAYPHLI